MTVKLRPYQIDLKNGVYDAWRSGARNVLAVAPTGSGKTAVFADIFHDAAGTPGVAIAHRQELVGQISLALARNGVYHNIVASTGTVQACIRQHIERLGKNFHHARAPIAVAGVQTIIRRGAQMEQWAPSVRLWATDECFPAGTLVDGRAIESLHVGDLVTAFDADTGEFHLCPVTHLFEREMPNYMVRIVTEGHHVLTTTLEHPIWTKRGWVNAGEITNDDEVYYVRRKSGSTTRIDETVPGNWSAVLQQNVQQGVPGAAFIGNNGEYESQICIGTDDGAQSDAACGSAREGQQNTEGNKPSAEDTRGQRSAGNSGGSEVDGNVRWPGVSESGHRADGTISSSAGLPGALQNRLRIEDAEDSDRGGRRQPCEHEAARTGSAQGCVSDWSRVASVSLLKRGDIVGTGNGKVYNIEVRGLSTYTANDVVVHNCHHTLPKNSWGKAASMFPNAVGLGVTASPIRCDKQPLGRQHGGLFDAMVIGPSMRDLINTGYLAEYRIFAPHESINLANVKVSNTTGDYNQDSLRKEAHRSTITGDIVSHYLKLTPGKRGITFVVDVEQAIEVCAKFNAAGVPADAVSAKTPDHVRENSIRRFERGEILQLVNVDLFGEGFDVPAVEVVSMGRPTQSLGLYLQQFGRALRPLEGKTHGVLLDHAGNVKRHGLPDAVRNWTLDVDERGTRSKRDLGTIPVTTCVECFSAYEALTKVCPYCGHVSVPSSRNAPEFVDGDLIEFSPELLARLRSDVDRVLEGGRSIPVGATTPIVRRLEKLWGERQQALVELRDTINAWGGAQIHGVGHSESAAYRAFYHTFGVDVLTAQTLPRERMIELTAQIRSTL